MNFIAAIRREKLEHPERFCPKCLWRVETRQGYKPCKNHSVGDSWANGRTPMWTSPTASDKSPPIGSSPTEQHGERSEAGASRHCTGAAAVESPSREASTPVGSPAPLLAPVGLPDSRPHPADCDCPKCVMPF